MNICIDTDGPMAQSLLDDNHELMQYYLLNYTPLVFINDHLYKGNLKEMLHLVESICMTFEEPPKECLGLDIFTDYNNFSGSSVLGYLGKLMGGFGVLLVVFVSVFYFCYKRRLKAKMDLELSGKINEAIMKYYGPNQTGSRYQSVSGKSGKEEMSQQEKKISIENSLHEKNQK